MGDVVALVEKAAEAIEEEEAMRMAQRMAKGKFDLNDFLTQIRQLKKMGGVGGLLGMLPGIGKMNKQLAAAGVDDSMIKRQEAIILSMTKKERVSVGLLNASRRKRIASGSGTSVQEVNRVVKQYQDMARMMKKMGSKAGAAGLKAMMGGGSPAGLPGGSSMDLDAMAKQFGSAKAGGLPNLGGMPNLGGLPPGINPNRKK
jgi:signal recognition particle subunit SRP54